MADFFLYGGYFVLLFPFYTGFEAPNFTQVSLQPSCADSWLKSHPQTWLLANDRLYRPKRKLQYQKWRTYMSKRLFSKPIHT